MYFEKTRELLGRYAELGKPIGATEAEILSAERQLGLKFPEAYREFLSLFGRDYKGILRGSDVFIDHLESNRQACEQLLALWEIESALPETAVVWLTHQGYVASWFVPTSGVPDPEVFLFAEGSTELGVQRRSSLSAFIHDDIAGLLGRRDVTRYR